MICKSRLPALALCLLVAGVLADSGADTVNERLPFSRGEMEAQWKVDCTATWGQLETWQSTMSRSRPCSIPEALRRDLQLCAFIYQPPGQPAHADCPDYQGVLQRMENCAMLSTWLGEESPCRSGAQAD